MLKKGKIKTYNEERGFGFISVEDEQIEIFFHISDMPHRHILPRNGETVSFKIMNYEGKKKAGNIKRLDVFPNQVSKRKFQKLQTKSRKGNLSIFIGILIAVLVLAIYLKYQTIQDIKIQKLQQKEEEQKQQVLKQQASSIVEDKKNYPKENQIKEQRISIQKPVRIPSSVQPFKCDGRVYCSQMRSYEEALYFLRNCPQTKLDGDRDGLPCENDSRWK